jgi:hypothetical protein
MEREEDEDEINAGCILWSVAAWWAHGRKQSSAFC